MKKRTKKIFAIFMIISLVLGVIDFSYLPYFSVTAKANDSDFLIDDEGALLSYNGNGGDVIIPDGVVVIGSQVFYGNDEITSVTFPDSILRIGDYAFYGCENLSSVIFPEGLQKIGRCAFMSCGSIESVSIPDYVLLEVSSFRGCTSLNNVELQANVQLSADVFSYCNSLESFAFPENETVVTSAVSSCINLTEVTLPQNAKIIDKSAFIGCTNLSNIVIPSSVTEIGDYAFYRCRALTEIELPDGLTDLGRDVFCDCVSLENIVIPEGITSIKGDLFSGCTSLESIEWSDNISGQFASGGLFNNCRSLTRIKIPENVTYIDSRIFYGCSSLEEFLVSENSAYFSIIDGVLFNKNSRLELIHYPEAKSSTYVVPDGTKAIRLDAFNGNASIESVTVPDSVIEIGAEAFKDCTALAELIISNPDTTLGTDALAGCTSLNSYTMGNEVIQMSSYDFDINENGVLISYRGNDENVIIPSSVNIIGERAFQNNTTIRSVVISDSVTAIKDDAFSGCTNLSDINFTENLDELGNGVFVGCTSLPSSMVFPDNISKIGRRITYDTNVVDYTFLSDDIDMPCDAIDMELFDENNNFIGHRTDIIIRGNKNSVAEFNAKRMGHIFVALDRDETIEYANVKNCYDVTLGLTNEYINFLSEFYITKYPEMGLERLRCSAEDHEFFAKIANIVISENPNKNAPNALYDWIIENIETEKFGYGYPIDVYKYKKADCLGKAYLLCELLRAAGIPAVVAEGYVGNMVTSVNEHMLFNHELDNHAWVLYYFDDKWQSLDAAQRNNFGEIEDIASWYYIKAVDCISLRTEYFTYYTYDLWARVLLDDAFVNYDLGNQIGSNRAVIDPEGFCMFWDNEKRRSWLDKEGERGSTLGESGWYIEKRGNNTEFYYYLKPNGQILTQSDTMERNGHLYWFSENGVAFDITGHSGNFIKGWPVYEVGDTITINRFGNISETDSIRYVNNYETVSDMQENGVLKINKVGGNTIDLYLSTPEWGESYQGSFGFYAVNSAPYQDIGLKAEAGTNEVTLSWNDIPNAIRFVIKEYVNGVWIDRKMINQNVSSVKIDGLTNGKEYIFAIDVYAPIKKYGLEYRFETGDQVTVTPEDMCAKAQDELGQELNNAGTASQKVDSIQENLSMDSMVLVMSESSDSLEQIKQLESDYATEKKIVSSIEVNDDSKDLIDQDKVKMVGGAMNVENGNATLDISRPENEKDVDTNRYTNNVQLDIKLMNGENEHRDLRMPVSITLPVPTGLLLNKLVILHYMSDGRPETVQWHNNGNGTISFVVKHFSTFMLANEEGLVINEESFPDSTFRAYVSDNFDLDQDGKLSQEEVDSVSIINCAGSEGQLGNITALTGIEFFTNLRELDCSYNRIVHIDISKNTLLERLRCFGNSISSLDISNNSALVSVNCSNNDLPELDVSCNPNLKTLICEGNDFSEIDISGCPELRSTFEQGEKQDPSDELGEEGIAWQYRHEGSILQVGSSVEVDLPVIVKTASLTLEGQIGLNFRLSIPDSIKNADQAKAVIVYKGKEVQSIPLAGLSPISGSTNDYKFTYAVPAKEMANKIGIKVVKGNGNEWTMVNSKGVIYDNNYFQFSVTDYCSIVPESATKVKNLANALQNYGAYAWRYFKSADIEPDLATAVDMSGINASVLEEYKFSSSGSISGLTIKTIWLELQSETTIKIRFELGDGLLLDDLSIEGATYSTTNTETGFVLNIPNVSAKNLDKVFEITVAKGSESVNMQVSALSYVYTVLKNSNDSDTLNAVKALYLYNQAANSYFE